MNILVKDVKIPEIEENKSIKAEIRNLDGKLELGIMTGGYYCSQQWLYYPLAEAPEQKHGKWVIYPISMLDGEDVKCSECGQISCLPYWNYCPNCGAKMS